jgi:foldase protein PrsA
MKKFIAAMLIIVLIISLTACGSDSELVNVGEKTITEKELGQYLEWSAFIQGVDLTQVTDEGMKVIKSQMLEDMISIEIIKKHYAGKEDEILPDSIEEDTNTFIDEAKKMSGVKEFLKENDITDDILTEFFRNQYFTIAYLEEIEAGMPTLEEDSQTYYESNKESFKIDEITASHILVEEEELAKEILKKLEAGEKFEDLAAQYGTDGTKDTGGSLGTFGKGRMVQEFEEAAFALQPGEISEVVKTQFGYHIIMVSDKNQGYREYDDVKESIKSTLVSDEAQKQIQALKDDIEVEYLTDEYPYQAA